MYNDIYRKRIGAFITETEKELRFWQIKEEPEAEEVGGVHYKNLLWMVLNIV